MISIHEALQRCLDSAPAVRAESIAITAGLGRVLAEDVVARTALPPWDNSAMDGFAVRASDTALAGTFESSDDPCGETSAVQQGGPRLRIVETIAAGTVGKHVLGAGETARIMTGAPMPEGADAVVMREHTTATETDVEIHQAATTGQHIRKHGEDVATGQTVLQKGTVLSPAALGLCAAVGREQILVSQQPRVAIVSTGDELVPPGQALGPGQIHSSNAHSIAGLIHQAGGIPIDCGIAADDLEETHRAFMKAADCDVIISTGGVSVGDFDLVRQAMQDLGADMQFWKVKIKPGKPLAFGIIQGTPTFGLPGNPVSCQVGFLQFVRPWIRMVLGDPNPFLPVIQARIRSPYFKRAGRAELSRVQVRWENQEWTATPTGSQGSGSQTSMVLANGLMLLPEEGVQLSANDLVHVQIIGDAVPSGTTPGYPW